MPGVASGRADIKLRLPLLLWRKAAAARSLAIVDAGWPCRSTLACHTHLHPLLSCCDSHVTAAGKQPPLAAHLSGRRQACLRGCWGCAQCRASGTCSSGLLRRMCRAGDCGPSPSRPGTPAGSLGPAAPPLPNPARSLLCQPLHIPADKKAALHLLDLRAQPSDSVLIAVQVKAGWGRWQSGACRGWQGT